MKQAVLRPKLTINADFTPSDITPKSLRLDSRSNQALENEPPTQPTPRVLTSRLPSYSMKQPSIRELESHGSIDISHTTPSNQILPLSNRSASKISVTSPSSPAKNFTSEYFRTASLAINHMKTQEKILSDIPEEIQLPKIELRPIPSFRVPITERIDRTNEYFGATLSNPITAQTSRSNKAFYFQTLSSRGFERIKTEDMEESAYEKNSQIIEKGSKNYMKKVSTLNFAEVRKTSYGTRTLSHDFRNIDSFIPQMPKLRTRQQSQVESVKSDRDNIFFLTEKGGHKESTEGSDIENIDTESELIEIAENQMNHISLQKSVTTYCKINVVDKYSPLSISIIGGKNVKRIRSFVSTSNQRPSKVNCDDKYEARNYKLYEKNRATAKFLNPYFYIALFPNDNGFVSIKIEFAQKKPATAAHEIRKAPGKAMLKKQSYFPDMLADMDKKEMYQEIWRIKRERKEKMLTLSNGVNKIEFNKNTEQYIPTKASEKREMLKEKTESQLKMAQSRKCVLDQEKKGMRKANMMKHDLQKMIKDIASGETKKAMTLRFLLEKWILNIFFCKLGESFKQILRKQRIVRAKRERLVFSLAQFKFKMRYALIRKGEFPVDRLKFDIKMALQLHANCIQSTRMHEVNRVVISFLQDNMLIHYIKNKFLNTFQSLKRVQETFRGYLRRKEGFKSCILLLWDKNYMKIYHECMQSAPAVVASSTVVAKPVLRKLHTLDLSVIDAARKKFVKTWFKRCILKYKKNYHIHYLEVANLSHEEKQEWHLKNMFMKMEQKEKEIPLIEKLKKASKAGLMEEFKKNNIANIDYGGPDISHQQKLIIPRLFLLPTPDELTELIKEVILKQKEAVK